MGLDIYAGTFVRYYAKNWKTQTQQFCEKNGLTYNIIRANPKEHENTASVEEIIEGVNSWQEQMKIMLSNHDINSFEFWDENNEKEYYTDKPDWDAFGAMLLMTAATVLKKDFPKDYQKGMDFHPYIYEAFEQKLSNWSLFAGVCHFIPQKEYITFNWLLANGKEASISTVASLKAELDIINQLLWNADEKTILEWNHSEGYPTDGTVQNGIYQKGTVHTVYDTESLAKYAFSIFYQAVQFAEKNNVPIILDF